VQYDEGGVSGDGGMIILVNGPVRRWRRSVVHVDLSLVQLCEGLQRRGHGREGKEEGEDGRGGTHDGAARIESDIDDIIVRCSHKKLHYVI
jgi:hypothetical protein